MDNISAVKAICELSKDAEFKLEKFVSLLREWQQVHNLISSDSLEYVWTRHIADSVQTFLALPDAQRWVDFGSGAGFPGIVVAIMLAKNSNSMVHLIESNKKKATFLQTISRNIEIPIQVHCMRIESFLTQWNSQVDGVSARALTDLDNLCGFAQKLVNQGATAVFHKGQTVQKEIDNANKKWNIGLKVEKSRIDPNGCLLIINKIYSKF